MNTFIQSFLAFSSCLFFAGQSIAGAPPVKSALKVDMYPVTDTYKMNVLVEKVADQPLTVLLKDKNQKLIHKHTIVSKSMLLSQKLDFGGLEDGIYYLSISDGESEVVKEIMFSSTNASDFTYLNLIAEDK